MNVYNLIQQLGLHSNNPKMRVLVLNPTTGKYQEVEAMVDVDDYRRRSGSRSQGHWPLSQELASKKVS